MYQSVGLGSSELGIDHDDLIQEGSIGLLRAITLYDPSKKIKFLTYAGQTIRNAMMDLISGEEYIQRSELIADLYAAEQRYNTPDFPVKNRVPRNRWFLWILPVKGKIHPL